MKHRVVVFLMLLTLTGCAGMQRGLLIILGNSGGRRLDRRSVRIQRRPD